MNPSTLNKKLSKKFLSNVKLKINSDAGYINKFAKATVIPLFTDRDGIIEDLGQVKACIDKTKYNRLIAMIIVESYSLIDDIKKKLIETTV